MTHHKHLRKETGHCVCGDAFQPCGNHVEVDPENPCDECMALVWDALAERVAKRSDKGEWVINAFIRMHTDGDEVTRVIVEPLNGATFYNESPTAGNYFNQDDINDALNRYLDKITIDEELGRYLDNAVRQNPDAGNTYPLEWEG